MYMNFHTIRFVLLCVWTKNLISFLEKHETHGLCTPAITKRLIPNASEESNIYGHHQGKEGACDRRDKKALAYAVNKVIMTKRNTLLKERLAG